MVLDFGQVADYLSAWEVRSAKNVGTLTGASGDGVLDAGMAELHALVTARLASDSAVRQLERDATAGIENERTKRRVRDAVEQAAEDDPGFAEQLRNVLDDLAKVGGHTAVPERTGGTGRFDPFDLLPVFPISVRQRHSGWLALPALAAGLLVVAATAADGTLGSPHDLQWGQDLRLAFSHSVQPTEASFPLIRDMPSVFLFFVIAAGVILLHRQWQFISGALPELRRANVITARRRPKSNIVSRVLGIERLIGECGDYQALDRLDQRMGQIKTKTKVLLSGGVLVGGFIMATLAVNGLGRDTFLFLAPTTLSGAQRQQWLAQARESWWAGPDHPMGLVLYALSAWFAMCLVLACSVVGVATVYMAVALYFVAELDADWYDRDGRYGWRPVARICRTMYYCLVLLGSGISFVVTILGIQIAFSLVGLIALYVLFIPIFTVVPWIVFQKIEKQVRQKRLDELTLASQRVGSSDLGPARSFVEEFARCREARINPMRLRTLPSGAFASVVLLPVLLTALQIYAQVGLGRFGV